MLIKNEDVLWKGLVKACFPDFIRFIHPGIDLLIDLDRGWEFLDKELLQVYRPTDRMDAPRTVDKLVKVYLREDPSDWVILHFEF